MVVRIIPTVLKGTICQTAHAQYLTFAFRNYRIISDVINLNNYTTLAHLVTPPL